MDFNQIGKMLIYVFESLKWIETEKLYPHDIALILNPSEKKIYLWEGPRSTVQMKEEAEDYVDDLKVKFQGFEYIKSEEKIPTNIKGEIEEKLDKKFEASQKFDRAPQYVAFLYIGFISLGFLAVTYLFILFPLGWNLSITSPGNYSADELGFSVWVQNTSWTIFTAIVVFVILLLSAIFTKKVFLIATAVIGGSIQLGTYYYVNLGVYLFDFQGESFQYPPYLIPIPNVILYALLNLLGLVATVIPLIISIQAIKRDTIPISWKEWREKKEKGKEVVRFKKVSFFTEKTGGFIPFDPNNPEEEYNGEEINDIGEQKP
ncbi:MAG: hypothetical protein ACTSWY_05775 [Promethearchaeota archaeon]